MFRPPSTPRRPVSGGFSDIWETDLTAPDPDRLTDLGKRLDELQTKQADRAKRPPPSQSGIAFRFATEMVAGLIVGGGLGWGIDWLFGVTMAERGVSQLVSVSLAEAEKIAAE